ncbi:unnamed protein product [Paramecium pentaurelia]|uniref:Rab-GAP TBC domain-containing protein n=1 Tax=Paramecium pentaurelia TaxID=43138 RepID=A0A8S1X8R7_9CILI|nr:unnamed protein product [Paramecium pentaurelia]
MNLSKTNEQNENDMMESLPFEIIQLSRRRNRVQFGQNSNRQSQSRIFKRSISESKEDIQNMNFQDQKQLKSKDDQPITEKEQFEYKLIQVEISDFVIIEPCKNGKEYQLLKQEDWKKIISQKSLNGYNLLDIHVSLLAQRLNFFERRDLWQFFCQVELIKYQIQQTTNSFFKYSIQENNYRSQIDKDIPRTLMGCEFLKNPDNIQSLKKILIAYANYDPELGYTQGMNIIAANLLICYDLQYNDHQFLENVEIFDPTRDEIVFYIFIYVMIELKWRQVFMPGFPGLIRLMKTLNLKFMSELPQLYKHFQEVGVDFNICFQYQYFTLLMYGNSWKISRMIFDVFLFEGEEIIHTFIIGMLKCCEDSLLKLYTFEEILKFCKNDMIQQFYGIFSVHLDGKKDLTNTLFNLGFIKLQGKIKESDPKNTEQAKILQKNQNQFGQIKQLGGYLRKFFRKT